MCKLQITLHLCFNKVMGLHCSMCVFVMKEWKIFGIGHILHRCETIPDNDNLLGVKCSYYISKRYHRKTSKEEIALKAGMIFTKPV